MARVIEATDPHAAWATMSVRTLMTVFVYGLVIGLITYVLFILLERVVFEPVLCREGMALARCESKDEIAAGVAIILGSFGGLALLVRERIYRPIMAILGVALSLWGVFSLIATMPVILAAIVIALTFATAYMLFAWLVQPTSLVVSIVGVLIAIILARIALG